MPSRCRLVGQRRAISTSSTTLNKNDNNTDDDDDDDEHHHHRYHHRCVRLQPPTVRIVLVGASKAAFSSHPGAIRTLR